MNDLDSNGNPVATPSTSTTTSTGSGFDDRLPGDQGQMVPSAMGATSAGADVIREEDKIQLVLAYLFPFIPLLTVKDNEYVQWHARQGFVNWVLSIPLTVTCVGWLFTLFVAIKGIMEALKPKRWEAPLVSNITKAIFK